MPFDNPVVVQAITAAPASPVHGELVIVTLRVATLGYQPFAVPCWLEIDGAVTPGETHTTRPVGETFEVHLPWIAIAGSHRIVGCAGPQGSERRLLDNRAELALEVGLSTRPWLDEWKEAARRGVKSWLAGSHVRGGSVDGNVGRLTPGTLASDRSVYEAMLARLLQQGEPAPVAAAVANAIEKAWRRWFDGYSTALTFDPSFLAYPGPFHPPAPAIVPAPLAAGGSSGAGALLPGGVARHLRDELRSLAPALSEVIDAFDAWFTRCFALWLATSVLVGVTGSGPVPSFAPPYAPIGPVVGGLLDSRDGVLTDHGAFDGG